MKDLYTALGIDPKASKEEVAAALELRPEPPDDAGILLDKNKRDVYDSTYTTLKTIGALRHRLDLDTGDSWFLEKYPDFALKKRPAVTAERAVESTAKSATQEGYQETSQPTHRKPRPAARSKRLAPLYFVIIGAILIAAYFVLGRT